MVLLFFVYKHLFFLDPNGFHPCMAYIVWGVLGDCECSYCFAKSAVYLYT